MAITLDDLLGRNRRPEQDPEPEKDERTRFPSFEEFQSLRNKTTQNTDSAGGGVQCAENREETPVFSRYNYMENPTQSMNIYEFTRRDHDTISESESSTKINYTNESWRPVFNKQDEIQAAEQRRTIFTRRAEAETEEVQNTEKKRNPLNLKGKLIIAGYVALVAVVAVLIIVNSGKLNLGKATTPSSYVSDSAIVQVIDK